MMLTAFIKRYRTMILVSIFFFYMGFGISLCLLRIECVDTGSNLKLDSKIDKTNPANELEYIVLILSSPENEIKRNAIRATWMKFSSNIFEDNGEKLYKWSHSWDQSLKQDLIKFYFVIGTQSLNQVSLTNLRLESEKNDDLLLLEDVEDGYEKLTRKMLHTLKWLSENFRRLKYVIKCDDDSFVRIDLIVRDLEAYAPEMNAPVLSEYVSYKKNLAAYKGLYWGYFNGKAQVYLSGKWQEQDWFLCDKYLPYALGGGYVISRSIVEYIAQNSNFLSQYNSEDISLGVWIAALDGINRVHDIRFDTEWKSRGCNNHMLVRHKQTPTDMFEMYKTLVNSKGNKLCKIENIERKSYVYKWNTLPSSCCK